MEKRKYAKMQALEMEVMFMQEAGKRTGKLQNILDWSAVRSRNVWRGAISGSESRRQGYSQGPMTKIVFAASLRIYSREKTQPLEQLLDDPGIHGRSCPVWGIRHEELSKCLWEDENTRTKVDKEGYSRVHYL